MADWNILGQEHIVAALERSLRQGQLAHAYTIVGPPKSGKSTLATRLAQSVNCQADDPPCGRCPQCRRILRGLHTDVQVIVPTLNERTGRMRTEIAIDQVRDLEQAAALGPYEGKCRVFIVDGAERMSGEAANALLKTLEEPPANVLLLLLTSREDGLLPTIHSRCQRLELHLLGMETIARELIERHNVGEEDARLLAKLSGGKLGWAIAAAHDPKVLEGRQERHEALLEVLESGLERRFQTAQELAALFGRDRAAAIETLALWLSWWRDLLVIQQEAPSLLQNDDWRKSLEVRAARITQDQAMAAVREVLATMERLEQNANARIALDVLMLGLPRIEAVASGQVS